MSRAKGKETGKKKALSSAKRKSFPEAGTPFWESCRKATARIYESAVGRFFFSLFLLAAAYLLNLLFSRNQYETFILLTGIEALTLLLSVWLFYLFKARRQNHENEEDVRESL